MSRRHNSSRRRSYGKRQHEVRERRAGYPLERDWAGRSDIGDWRIGDTDDGRQTGGSADGLGGARL